MPGAVRIGTSGWSYDHWAGPFYPSGLPPRERLAYYADRFPTVEVNGTFYRLPGPETVRHWRDTVPHGFVFSVKASRYITHMTKLLHPDRTLPPFLERIRLLGAALGPVLFQLPPRWRADPDRLDAFLTHLDGRHRYAVEVRDPSWHDDRVRSVLERHRVASCIADLGGTVSPRTVTADFVYLRLHGPGAAYQGQYAEAALAGWAADIAAWRDAGLDVYCYFDNDEAGFAAADALRLRAILDGP